MAQYARPNSVVDQGLWTGSYTDIDESSPSDSDYINSDSSNGSSIEFTLTELQKPKTTAVTVRVRYKVASTVSTYDKRNLNVKIYESGNSTPVYSTWFLTINTSSFTTATLTNVDLSAVVNWNLEAAFSDGIEEKKSKRNSVYVSWFEIETDDPNPVLEAAKGSFTLTGKDADIKREFKLSANQRAYLLDGKSVSLISARVIAGGLGAFGVGTVATSLLVARRLIVDVSAYGFANISAEIAFNRYLTCNQAGCIIVGQAVGIAYGRTMAAEHAEVVLDIYQAGIFTRRTIGAVLAGYTFGGQTADMVASRLLMVDYKDFNLTGDLVLMLVARLLTMGTAAYTAIGKAIVLAPTVATLSVENAWHVHYADGIWQHPVKKNQDFLWYLVLWRNRR